jgi:hypothetical protein
MSPTTLYTAAYRGQVSGLAFHVGPTLLFTPVDDPRVYVIADPAQLVIAGPVDGGMAAFLTRTLIEPRLAQAGGAAWPCIN